MNSRTSISKDESNILVAIGKIETQMDGLRSDVAGARSEIKEINTGITARLLNLEGNAVSRIEINPRMSALEERQDGLEERVSALETTLKSYWNACLVGGSIAVVILGGLEFIFSKYN